MSVVVTWPYRIKGSLFIKGSLYELKYYYLIATAGVLPSSRQCPIVFTESSHVPHRDTSPIAFTAYRHYVLPFQILFGAAVGAWPKSGDALA